MQRERRVSGHVTSRTLAGPTHHMKTCIHHEAAGSPHLVRETSKVAVRVAIKTNLQPQAFGVQSPSFLVRHGADVTAKRRQPLNLLLQCNLKVVSRDSFVKRQCLDLVKGAALQVVRVDIVEASAFSVAAAGHVVGRGGAWCDVGWDLANAIRGSWKLSKQAGELAVHTLQHEARCLQKLLGRLGVKLGVRS